MLLFRQMIDPRKCCCDLAKWLDYAQPHAATARFGLCQVSLTSNQIGAFAAIRLYGPLGMLGTELMLH